MWCETHTNKNMNATSSMISPHCVIQTLLTLLKNWCLSPPLYLLLQSRGRFLTVLFISFFTHWSIFWESHSENTSHFQEFQSKEIDTFFNNKSQSKSFFGWLFWGFKSWIPEKWWIKHISIPQNILISKTSTSAIHTIYEWNSQV